MRSTVVLRFNRADFLVALEARRPWAEATDKANLAEHRKAEKEYLDLFRSACREALKWDYTTAAKHSFSIADLFGRKFRPHCPPSLVAKLDMVIRGLELSRQERFTVSPDGQWHTAHYLLTYTDDDTGDLC